MTGFADTNNWGVPVHPKLGLEPVLRATVAPSIAQPSQNAPMEAAGFLRGTVKLAARQARAFTEVQIMEIDKLVVGLIMQLILAEDYIRFEWDSAPAGCAFSIECVNYRAKRGGYFIEIFLKYPGKVRRLVIEDSSES